MVAAAVAAAAATTTTTTTTIKATQPKAATHSHGDSYALVIVPEHKKDLVIFLKITFEKHQTFFSS